MENKSLDDSLNRRKEFYLGMIEKAIGIAYETRNIEYIESVEGYVYQLSRDLLRGLEEVTQAVDEEIKKRNKSKYLPSQEDYNKLRDTPLSHQEVAEHLNLPSLPGYFALQYKNLKKKFSHNKDMAKKRYYESRAKGLDHKEARKILENEGYRIQGLFYSGLAGAYAKYSNKQFNK